jgi:hypothetical protein
MRRRPSLNEGYELAFRNQMTDVFARLTPIDIYNMDETRWCLISSHQITIAMRGQDNVTANFSRDPKESLTVIHIITASGGKLPLQVICKGVTRRCESRYEQRFQQDIAAGQLLLCHQRSGWTDVNIAKAVKSYAPTRQTKLVYIPAATTDRHQPLDRHIFGNLKNRARASFEALWIRDPGYELNLLGAIEILLNVWDAIGQDEILEAWSEPSSSRD